jgi:hypothetical protein
MKRREFISLLGGAAASWPLAARAQQPLPIIGFLDMRSPGEAADAVAHFRSGLSEAGFIEGRNAAIEYRWAEGHSDRLRRRHRSGPGWAGGELQSALQIHVLSASTDSEIDAAFANAARERIAALAVGADPFFDKRRDQLAALAARHAVPTVYHFREYAEAGGLMSYGIDVLDVYRQVGIYAGRILKGEKPADLPVLQPTKFELVINLKTAKVLGAKISDNLLSLADEVIE